MGNMVLIILTSHRRDCLTICLHNLERHTDLDRFAVVYVLANAVEPEHRALIDAFRARHPNVVDVHFGPRGILHAVRTESFILESHRNDIVVKLDEDVFVTPGWLDAMLAAYRKGRADGIALVSALVPNNQIGKNCLDAALRRRFPYGYSEVVRHDPVHENPLYGVWIWQRFLKGDLRDARCGIIRDCDRHIFTGALNINCILFDRRIMDAVLPFTTTDEHAINTALARHDMKGIMVPEAVAHHYSFGPQQAHLDAAIGTRRIANAFGIDAGASFTDLPAVREFASAAGAA